MCRHEWSKWADIREGKVVRKYTNFDQATSKEVKGQYIVQRRECEKCGRKQLHAVSTYY